MKPELPPKEAVRRARPRPTFRDRKKDDPKNRLRAGVTMELLPRKLAKAADPEWDALEQKGYELAQHRLKELVDGLGFVGASAALMLLYEAQAAADAEWVRNLAKKEGDPALLKLAHQIRQFGRQHGLTAFELAVREAILHREEEPDQRAALEAELDDGLPSDGQATEQTT